MLRSAGLFASPSDEEGANDVVRSDDEARPPPTTEAAQNEANLLGVAAPVAVAAAPDEPQPLNPILAMAGFTTDPLTPPERGASQPAVDEPVVTERPRSAPSADEKPPSPKARRRRIGRPAQTRAQILRERRTHPAEPRRVGRPARGDVSPAAADSQPKTAARAKSQPTRDPTHRRQAAPKRQISRSRTPVKPVADTLDVKPTRKAARRTIQSNSLSPARRPPVEQKTPKSRSRSPNPMRKQPKATDTRSHSSSKFPETPANAETASSVTDETAHKKPRSPSIFSRTVLPLFKRGNKDEQALEPLLPEDDEEAEDASAAVSAKTTPSASRRNSGGGLFARALANEDELRRALSEIDSATRHIATPPKYSGGMIFAALAEAKATVSPEGIWLDGTSSHDSAGSGGSQRQFVPKRQATDGTVDVTPPIAQQHLPSVYKDDVSYRLLSLCKKAEWTMVDSLMRYTEKKKFDMSVADETGFTAFLYAVKEGRISLSDKLLEFGADITSKTKDGRNAAHVAAMYAKDDILRFLLSRRQDLARGKGPAGQLPLHVAASRPSAAVLLMVQLLLRSTNIPDKEVRLIEDQNGCIPLHLSAENGNAIVCKELLQTWGEKQTGAQRKDTGDTSLHMACKSRNLELARMLVEHGAPVNVQNWEGRTALHYCAATGDEDLLRVLYKRADPNIADKEDKTPLHVAAEHGHTHVVEILVDKFKASVLARTKDGSTLMHIASMNGHSQTALACLKRGVPLHMPNKTGALGLHCAAAMGHVPMVKTLLSKGTNVDIRTKENYTALHVAVQSGKAEVVETLLGQGADVHVQGGKIGETALHIAAGLSGADAKHCADMLLKSGAEANIRRQDGETALHIAARQGHIAMMQLLLNEGADPKAASEEGLTAAHVAVKNCHHEAAKMLLNFIKNPKERSEYVNLKTTDGVTALHYAAEIQKEQTHFPKEDAKLMTLLIDSGGETNETVMHRCARNGNEDVLRAIVSKIGPGAVQIALNKQAKNGWSPLLEACDRGHAGVVQLLLENHARVDVFDDHGKTGLHLASENGHMDTVEILVANKAFVNSKSKHGETPLHLCAMNGHDAVARLLVGQHGASLEASTLDYQTPLHYTAKRGELATCSDLLALGSNANAKDNKGQTPLHLAAENDHPEVVKLFLKMKQNNRSVLTAVDESGFTCAHIAAMKGSVAVVRELTTIDKAMVIEAKTKTTESTALHMAAAGGHKTIVQYLLENGAEEDDENAHGMTPLHLSAKNGHSHILSVFDNSLWRRCSRKTGLNPMHVAAFYGQLEFVREMLTTVPAVARSEPPTQYNPLIVKELSTEYGLTPLHMAAQSGHDRLVRMLINIQGVQVDASTTTLNVIPLHLAAQSGHIAVVGMLLSRSTVQLQVKDSKGRTALHLAAMNGHYDMVSLLIAQGSQINAMDQNGWTGMHFATKAGHLSVLRLFMQSSADPQAETRDGKIPLCFAALHNHVTCLSYLMQQEHDTHALMEDRKFIFDLMVCGKTTANKPLEDFILRSIAPIDTAVKLSSLYRDMSEKEKERARDLSNVAVFCENMAVELLSITATEYDPAVLLKAHDMRGRPFLDVLIENEQKDVVAHASVQRYLTEIWSGGIHWGSGKLFGFFALLLFCPPVWLAFSLPLDHRLSRAPIIKFIGHLISHIYFTALLIVVTLNLHERIYDVQTYWPHPAEWLLFIWLSGILVAELSSVGGGSSSGLGIVRLATLIFAAVALALHVGAFIYPVYFMQDADARARLRRRQEMLYLKNQFLASSLLAGFVQYLEFLTVHHLFGPWAIIISDLMYDLSRFLVILMLFVTGFTLHITSIFQPAYQERQLSDEALMRLANPLETLEFLFFSLFGLVEPDNMPPMDLVPFFSKYILKVVFGVYMMVTLIVLINLLIAMMSDTYQRIQAQADTEWKFGRAMLIREMNKRFATPAPINMLTKFIIFLRVLYRNRLGVCSVRAQMDFRYEENIDAFSIDKQTGHQTPTMKMLGSELNDSAGNFHDNLEAGKADDGKIETAIEWSRIVDIYYIYQGTDEKTTNKQDILANLGDA